MTIEVSFKAEINEKDYAEVKRGFDKAGAQIISENFPEMKAIYGFKTEQIASEKG